MSWTHDNAEFVDEYQKARQRALSVPKSGNQKLDAPPPIVSRGGRSFDWCGVRWRGEATSPALVANVVAGVMATYYPYEPVTLTGFGPVVSLWQ